MERLHRRIMTGYEIITSYLYYAQKRQESITGYVGTYALQTHLVFVVCMKVDAS